jgi:hypothetical protein
MTNIFAIKDSEENFLLHSSDPTEYFRKKSSRVPSKPFSTIQQRSQREERPKKTSPLITEKEAVSIWKSSQDEYPIPEFFNNVQKILPKEAVFINNFEHEPDKDEIYVVTAENPTYIQEKPDTFELEIEKPIEKETQDEEIVAWVDHQPVKINKNNLKFFVRGKGGEFQQITEPNKIDEFIKSKTFKVENKEIKQNTLDTKKLFWSNVQIENIQKSLISVQNYLYIIETLRMRLLHFVKGEIQGKNKEKSRERNKVFLKNLETNSQNLLVEKINGQILQEKLHHF